MGVIRLPLIYVRVIFHVCVNVIRLSS